MKINNKYEIIIDRHGQGCAVAVLDNGKIVDCFIDPHSNLNFYPPNTFLNARIERKISRMGGYFIKLPNDKQGFLKTKRDYPEGALLTLQSKVFYDLKKAQAFTDSFKITSKYFILKFGQQGIAFSKKLNNNFDKVGFMNLLKPSSEILANIFLICRSSAANVCESELSGHLKKILLRLRDIKKSILNGEIYYDGLAKNVAIEKYGTRYCRIIEDEGIFERIGIWDQLKQIEERKQYLNNGSYLIFDQTNAFLTIDVNSGKDLKISKEGLNLIASNEIARVIRVLGIGGKILIDFLPCSKKERQLIYEEISVSFSDDDVENNIWGWTKGGIFELQRERQKVPLKLLISDH